MRKLWIFVLILPIIISSCKSVPDQTDYAAYLGRWQRVGDEAAGDIIDVYAQGEENAYGKLVEVSPLSAEFGYRVGEIKWRFVKKLSSREYEIQNLNALIQQDKVTGQVLSRSKNYSLFKLVIINKQKIELQSIETLPTKVGNSQQWVKVKD